MPQLGSSSTEPSQDDAELEAAPAQVEEEPSPSTKRLDGLLSDARSFDAKFVFYPAPESEGEWEPENLNQEDVEFKSSDGVRLHGWYVPHESPNATILYCHGNGGNISHRAWPLRILHDKIGASVFIFDYRGYGRSEGKPGETGVYADARAARKWLAQREGIEEKEIVLLGRSLGGGVAVELASTDGARALILESTFTSTPDVAKASMSWLPAGAVMRNEFRSIDKIAKYKGPLFQSHGDKDRVIPYNLGRKLYASANEPKDFFTLRGAGHNGPPSVEYYKKMLAFLDDLPDE